MFETVVAHINLRALLHNFAQIQLLSPKSKVLAMVKGNGYGHGLIEIAQCLSHTSMLGVANLTEAMLLRDAGVKTPLLVMRGFMNQEELRVFQEDASIHACIHHASQIALLNNPNYLDNKINAWLHIDTGMHRLGFQFEDASVLVKTLLDTKRVNPQITLMTHLADADNVNSTFTKAQFIQFEKLASHYAGEKSLLHSAGTLKYSEYCGDWIRPGIALYGASPFAFGSADYRRTIKNFQPVMTLKSNIISLNRVLPGESIGYGCTYRVDREMMVATVAIGYAAGYPRILKSGTPVLVHNSRCPLVGRISMDMITVDVSGVNHPKIGDEVTLWGPGLPVDEIAALAGTIPYELLVQLGRQVKYIYV